MLPLVPTPTRLREMAGAPFEVTPGTVVVAPVAARAAAAAVARTLRQATGVVLPVRALADEHRDGLDTPHGATPRGDGLVVLALTGESVEPGAPGEAYALTVAADEVRLTARTVAGLHRGAATIGQLAVRDGGAARLPAVEIVDIPRYGWRGLSLDVARHFLPAADVAALIDLLAGYKFNVLHLHLTDDQGWRLDVPSYPELVARSSDGAVGDHPGGAYSADDWTRLVDCATSRGVALIPEVDTPGHVHAALHAVAGLNPDGVTPDSYHGTEVGFSTLRSELPATRRFLTDVFADLAAMTPGEYLHLGGDEAHSTSHDEYTRLVALAAGAVRAAGRTVVGWQEIAAVPLPPGAVVQFWDIHADTAPIVAAARAGAHVLMSPADRVYLDMRYTPDHPWGQDWAGCIELRDAYEWDPAATIPELSPAAVIGVEAALWTETLPTFDDVTAMLLPRLAAVAEVAWSSGRGRRSWSSSDDAWDGFRARLAPHAHAWNRAHLAWHPSPQVDWPVGPLER